MFLNKKNKLNYLELTPYHLHQHEVNGSGLVDVLVPRFNNQFLSRIFTPKNKSPYIRANLDEFGSVSWLLIDGISKVSLIAEELKNRFGDSIQPAEPRLTAFLTQLFNAGFISFNELKKGNKNEQSSIGT